MRAFLRWLGSEVDLLHCHDLLLGEEVFFSECAQRLVTAPRHRPSTLRQVRLVLCCAGREARRGVASSRAAQTAASCELRRCKKGRVAGQLDTAASDAQMKRVSQADGRRWCDRGGSQANTAWNGMLTLAARHPMAAKWLLWEQRRRAANHARGLVRSRVLAAQAAGSSSKSRCASAESSCERSSSRRGQPGMALRRRRRVRERRVCWRACADSGRGDAVCRRPARLLACMAAAAVLVCRAGGLWPWMRHRGASHLPTPHAP